MTLKEAFEAMRLDDRPVEYVDRYEQFYYDGHPIPDSLAESAICWAMVMALAKRQVFASVFSPSDDNPEWMAETEIEERHGKTPFTDLAAAYASAFPKEKA